jgi:hypothetical protein
MLDSPFDIATQGRAKNHELKDVQRASGSGPRSPCRDIAKQTVSPVLNSISFHPYTNNQHASRLTLSE